MDEPRPGSVDPEDRSDSSSAPQDTDLSFGKLAEEAVGELAGLERRLPRTLFLLLVRPGFVTLEHRRGRGADYVSPVRLYILASAIYFATSFAVAAEGLNLGLLTIVQTPVPLPRVAPALVLIAAVPIFALLLVGLFPRSARARGMGEYFIFALYFQSVLLVVLMVVGLLPIGDPANDLLKIGFFVAYVGLAARRLWSSHVFVALAKSFLSLALYAMAVVLAASAVGWVQSLIAR